MSTPGSTKEHAANVLRDLPNDKAFYFYTAENAPTGIMARSLKEFADRLQTVSLMSLEFHCHRGDFENWIRMLGDEKLAQQISRVKHQKLRGEELRARLTKLVGSSYGRLSKEASALS
jgi:hypothetical protein